MSTEIRSNHNIYNLTLTNANTEYSQVLTKNPTLISIKCRDSGADMKFSFVSGASGTTYITILGGTPWESKGRMVGIKTIYLQSSTAGVVAEIEEWT